MSSAKGSKVGPGAVKGQTLKEQLMSKASQHQEQPADQQQFSNDKNEANFLKSHETFSGNIEKSITGNKVSSEMSEEKHRGIQEADINHKGISRHHEQVVSKRNDKQLHDSEKVDFQQRHQNEPQNHGQLGSPDHILRPPTQHEELKKTNVEEFSKIQQVESIQPYQESSSKTHHEGTSMSYQGDTSKSHQEETSMFHQERFFPEVSSKSCEDGSSKCHQEGSSKSPNEGSSKSHQEAMSKSQLQESFKSQKEFPSNSFQEDHFRERLSKSQQKGSRMTHQKKLLNSHKKESSRISHQGDPSKNQAELEMDKDSNKTVSPEDDSEVLVKDVKK